MIVWTLTPDAARVLFGFLATVAVPFLTALLARPDWPKAARFGVAVVVSLVAALLAEYAAGTLAGPLSAAQAFAVIFTAAQAHYASWFKGLGLDDALSGAPRRSVE